MYKYSSNSKPYPSLFSLDPTTGKRTDMPTLSASVKGIQHYTLCDLTFTQNFMTEQDTSVSYLFHTDAKFCIYDTEFIVGEERIKPICKAKEEAKETFDEAVDTGRTAILGQMLTANCGEIHLGNIPAHTPISVILRISLTAVPTGLSSFVVKLPFEFNNPPQDFSCEINVIGAQKVTSNDGTGKIEDTKFITTLAPRGQLLITSTFAGESTGFKKGKYAHVTFTYQDEKTHVEEPTDFCFIIDCSGSMSGSRIDQAKQALEILIRSLPQDSRFTIIRFGTQHQYLLGNKWLKYTSSNVKNAIQQTKNMSADLGGTNFFPPLEDLYKMIERKTIAFFLTDGESCDHQITLDLVNQNADKCRIFTVGLGGGFDPGLITGMAERTQGKVTIVESARDLGPSLVEAMATSMAPCLANVHVDVPGCDDLRVLPFPIPSAFEGSPLMLQMTSQNDITDIMISGTDHDGEQIDIAIETESFAGEELALRGYFAFVQMRELLTQQQTTEVIQRIVQLSIDYNLVCQYTSFVGTTEQPTIKPPPQQAQLDDLELMQARILTRSSIGCANTYSADQCVSCCPPQEKSGGSCMGGGGGSSSSYKQSRSYESPQVHSPPPPPPAGPPVELWKQIVDLQEIDGSWTSLSKLEGASKKKMPTAVGPSQATLRATLFALAILRHLCADQSNMWKLIEKKAISWLTKADSTLDINVLISEIISGL